MQPEPLAPQPEEKQPNPPVQVEMKPESSAIHEKKSSKRNIISIVLGIFVVLLLAAIAGLGYWAYTLNSNLASTQQELASLQAEYDQLKTDHASVKSDNEQLTADLDQAKADLEKTVGDLASSQDDLTESRGQNELLNNQIDSASRFAEILYTFSNTASANDLLTVDSLINDTHNSQLITAWNNFTSAPSDQGAADFLLYLITIIRDSLK